MRSSAGSGLYKRFDRLTAPLTLTDKDIKNRIQDYGFIEASDIIRFLDFVSESGLEKSEYIYIRSKLEMCLKHHDNGSDYFIPLREFASELDCIIL